LAIDVECRAEGDGWRCSVRVDGTGGDTVHSVSVSRADLVRLDAGASEPGDLVRRSFEFLLERESNASILRSFELPEISRYFPEYERQIEKR